MNLFNRIKPNKTFHISIKDIAEMLRIPPNMIVRIERWRYVVFVHRKDIGGQFISYRTLQNWQHAVAMRIRSCNNIDKLEVVWLAIESDRSKYARHYKEAYHAFIEGVFFEQWDRIMEFLGRKDGRAVSRSEIIR